MFIGNILLFVCSLFFTVKEQTAAIAARITCVYASFGAKSAGLAKIKLYDNSSPLDDGTVG